MNRGSISWKKAVQWLKRRLRISEQTNIWDRFDTEAKLLLLVVTIKTGAGNFNTWLRKIPSILIRDALVACLYHVQLSNLHLSDSGRHRWCQTSDKVMARESLLSWQCLMGPGRNSETICCQTNTSQESQESSGTHVWQPWNEGTSELVLRKPPRTNADVRPAPQSFYSPPHVCLGMSPTISCAGRIRDHRVSAGIRGSGAPACSCRACSKYTDSRTL